MLSNKKSKNAFIFVAQWDPIVLRVYREHTQEPALSTGVLGLC